MEYFGTAIMLYGMVMMVRNDLVFNIRSYVLAKEGHAAYERLPGYGEMLLHPKYMLLWTTRHWLAWLARRDAVQCTDQPEEQ